MEAQSNSGNLILVIDDEEGVLDVIERFLAKNGFEVRTEAGAEAGLEFIRKNNVDLILVDMMMPGMGGLEFVRAAKDMKYPAEVMVMSGFGTVESAVDAIRFGAFDFIEKPLNFEKLLIDIQNAIKKSRLEDRIEFLENRIKSNIEFDGIVGNSTEFLKTKKLAEQISRTEVNLLITGESGTGKEVFARAVHNAGPRCGGPFMAVNCGAIAESLLESELFGHEKGAFSGAVARRTGHFENADGGTLFLDEIGELPMSLQVKLLRAV
ncbi:MAG TPA: sigma-54 dependent transcriptional regulator, partial [bacterium]|nr:sigma-54 dependent transcriptional regulator [bacterium]